MPITERLEQEEKVLHSEKEEGLTEWLEQCPVQQEDPDIEGLGEVEDCLVPGPVLKACSGSDIHLQKAASKKGKYLAILPGIFSWHEPETGRTGKGPSTAETENDPPPEAVIVSKPDNEEATDHPQATSRPGEAALISLGAIDRIESDRPSLSISVPGEKMLQMRGRRVQTTSKFLLLSLQPKKGKVICKHIFDSALVFGDASLVTAAVKDSGCGTTQLAREDDFDPASERPIHHSGASLRASSAVSGAFVRARRNNPSKLCDPIKSTQSSKEGGELGETSSSQGLDSHPESGCDDDDKNNNIDDSDSNSNYRGEKTLTVPQKRNSRRQSRKAVKYVEQVDESEDDTSDDSASAEHKQEDLSEDGSRGKSSDSTRKRKRETAKHDEDARSYSSGGCEQSNEIGTSSGDEGNISQRHSQKRNRQNGKSRKVKNPRESIEIHSNWKTSNDKEKFALSKSNCSSRKARPNQEEREEKISPREEDDDGHQTGDREVTGASLPKDSLRGHGKRRQSSTATKKAEICILSSEQEESHSDRGKDRENAQKKIEKDTIPTGRPRRQPKAAVKYTEDDSSVDEQDETKTENKDTSKPQVLTGRRGQRSSVPMSSSRKDGDNESSVKDNEEEDNDEGIDDQIANQKQKAHSRTRKKMRNSEPKKRTSALETHTPQDSEATKINTTGSEQEPDRPKSLCESSENDQTGRVGAAVQKKKVALGSPMSPCRRRRTLNQRRSPAGKNAIIDLVDEDYKFLG